MLTGFCVICGRERPCPPDADCRALKGKDYTRAWIAGKKRLGAAYQPQQRAPRVQLEPEESAELKALWRETNLLTSEARKIEAQSRIEAAKQKLEIAKKRHQLALEELERRNALKETWKEEAARPVADEEVRKIENIARSRELYARQRAKYHGVEIGQLGELLSYYQRVLSANRMTCYWCKRPLTRSERQVDHIVPIGKGGGHVLPNLCCSCERCNRSKSSKLAAEYRNQAELNLAG